MGFLWAFLLSPKASQGPLSPSIEITTQKLRATAYHVDNTRNQPMHVGPFQWLQAPPSLKLKISPPSFEFLCIHVCRRKERPRMKNTKKSKKAPVECGYCIQPTRWRHTHFHTRFIPSLLDALVVSKQKRRQKIKLTFQLFWFLFMFLRQHHPRLE
ncbi:hypothetical protein ABW19_dt0209675 [Dactylella cylindrospora]|nr:hypothetical protein ABW19_dt0209675 [Dactylella cylindrospora]